MTYLIELRFKEESFFGYRNAKREWVVAMTPSEGTAFKTEKGAWRALQNGDKFIVASAQGATCWHDLLQKRGYEVEVISSERAEEIMQTKSIQSTELTLIFRNAIKKQCRAFKNITSATVKSKATNFETQPFTDFAEIERLYDKYPNARLYQSSEWVYVLFVGTGDAVYRFAINNQPLSKTEPAPIPAMPAPEVASVTDVIPASAEPEALKQPAASAEAKQATITLHDGNEGDKVTALEAKYRRACDQYIETRREADALEVKATLKQQEAQVFHEKMKELHEQIEAAKQAFATTQTQGILMANSEQIYIRGTEITIEQAKKIADEGLNELFGNRHKLKQQFLTINKLLADTNGMKFGRTLINRESVLRLVIYWKGEKAVLEWTAGGWPEGWKIIPFRETADGGCMELKEHRGQQYQTKAVDADIELRGAWAGFNLFQRLKDSGIDVTDW